MGVCFINPHGAKAALYSLTVNYLGDFPITILEERSLSDWLKVESLADDISVATFIPAVTILAISFLFGFRKKSFNSVQGKPIFYFLAGAGTAGLSFKIISRGLLLFGSMFLPAVSGNFNGLFNKLREWIQQKYPAKKRALEKISVLVLIVTLTILIFLGGTGQVSKYKKPGIGLTASSESGALFLKEQSIHGPIFNDTNIGSYLIFHLFPGERIFTDNRFGDAYSLSFFKDIYLPMLENEEKWNEFAKKYELNLIYLHLYNDRAHQFLYRRIADQSWSLIYVDVYSIIFLKNNKENAGIIEKFKITQENAKKKLGHLSESSEADDQIAAADIFIIMGQDDLALEIFNKVVARWPGKGRIWMVMGQLKSKKDDPQSSALALAYLEKAIAMGQKTSEAYSFLGLAYYRTGHIDKAKEALNKALKINPERKDAKDLLNILENNI